MRSGYNHRHRWQKREPAPHYLINERILNPSLRLIDEKGKQIGILDREAARQMAREKALDLVLITNHVVPPVVKLIDFKKFLYQERKKQQETKKGSKKTGLKDIKLSLFIGKGDFERLVKKTQAFLAEGHQVRVGLLLKGREMAKKPMGFDLLREFIKAVGEVTISHEARLQGRVIITVIGKKK